MAFLESYLAHTGNSLLRQYPNCKDLATLHEQHGKCQHNDFLAKNLRQELKTFYEKKSNEQEAENP